MVSIDLSPEEAEVIRAALSSQHDILLLELSKADSLAFKETLRAREAVVSKVLKQLGASPRAQGKIAP